MTKQLMPDRPRRSILFALVMLFAAFVPFSNAAELDSKLEKTAKKMSSEAASLKLESATLAVFPFQADEKLTKSKANFAVSEILTKHLFKHGTFKFIERAQLEEVLKEQKLGASGAVDSRMAADIGKLMGAKLLVLGSVVKLGNSYQITSKLVNSETAELIMSDVAELSVSTFEQDARPYLYVAPPPEIGGIGLYVASVMRPEIKSSNYLQHTFAGTYNGIAARTYSLRITPDNPAVEKGSALGLGARYSPWRWLMLDVGYVPQLFSKAARMYSADAAGTLDADPSVGAARDTTTLKGSTLEVSANVNKIIKHFRFYAGGGLTRHFLGDMYANGDFLFAGYKQYIVSAGNADYVKIHAKAEVDKNAGTMNSPFLRLGTEWRPQPRVGFSVFWHYILSDDALTRTVYANVSEWGYSTVSGVTAPMTQLRVTKMPIYKFVLPRYYIKATLSLYF